MNLQVGELLPRLEPGSDYFLQPSLTQLAAMAREEPDSLAHVANFTVGRPGVGSVRWLEEVDVRGVDVEDLVRLSRGGVEVRTVLPPCACTSVDSVAIGWTLAVFVPSRAYTCILVKGEPYDQGCMCVLWHDCPALLSATLLLNVVALSLTAGVPR